MMLFKLANVTFALFGKFSITEFEDGLSSLCKWGWKSKLVLFDRVPLI
jgi:hypothetical protein